MEGQVVADCPSFTWVTDGVFKREKAFWS